MAAGLIPNPAGGIASSSRESLLTCPLATRVRVTRVTDQRDGFLQFLEQHRLKPGLRLQVDARDEQAETVLVQPVGAKPPQLGFRAAERVLVESV